MKRKLTILLILFVTVALINPASAGQVESVPNREFIQPNLEAKELDERAKILSNYFAKYDSPFENHGQDFIDAADTYGVDWKLVPAIAGVESTFGKNSFGYNAWGWGIYGDQNLNFTSWRTGIFTVTGGLKQNYINKGLTEPLAMNRAYAASPTWGTRVNYFIKDIDKFAAQDNKPQPVDNPLLKVAAGSAQITSK